jgi:hypothetical protein
MEMTVAHENAEFSFVLQFLRRSMRKYVDISMTCFWEWFDRNII